MDRDPLSATLFRHAVELTSAAESPGKGILNG
jgi:hypothetical protein